MVGGGVGTVLDQHFGNVYVVLVGSKEEGRHTQLTELERSIRNQIYSTGIKYKIV